MLNAVLESEQNAVRRYSQRAESANAYDDKAMVAQLEQMIREESIHVQETERVLSDCPL